MLTHSLFFSPSFVLHLNHFQGLYNVLMGHSQTSSASECLGSARRVRYATLDGHELARLGCLMREQEMKGLWSRYEHLVSFKTTFACQNHRLCLNFNILTHLYMKLRGYTSQFQSLFLFSADREITPAPERLFAACGCQIGDQWVLIVKLTVWRQNSIVLVLSPAHTGWHTSVTTSTVGAEGKLPAKAAGYKYEHVHCSVRYGWGVILSSANTTKTKKKTT